MKKNELKPVNDFTSNLQCFRVGKGLTQKALAEQAEIHWQTIANYESRIRDINKAQGYTLYKIALVLGCNMSDLLELDR